ncbi:MAG: hypothetical protein Q4F72_12085, partial [Desulfovibrionaceae bacterium]|nr:hypothetical protein [Desulfovibrionaceae bacterium]
WLVRMSLNQRCSPDAYVRRSRLEVFPPAIRLPMTAEDVIADSMRRFPVLVKDIADYGVRRDYVFTAASLSPGDPKKTLLAGSGLSSAVRPRKSKQRETQAELFEPEMRRLSLGDCLSRVISGYCSDGLDEWAVRWLCLDMGYSLDWLLLGLGPMCAEWAHSGADIASMPPSGTHRDPETGEIAYEDMTSLRDRQALSLWSFTDWQWLHNLRVLVKTNYRTPTIPLLSRMAAGWRIPNQLPQMPHILAWVDWLAGWCEKEFLEGVPAPGWKQNIIDQVVASRNQTLLLLGLSGQAGPQYRSAKAQPTTCVLRLAWLVRMAIDRRGRPGMLDYLDLVDSEARARGFEGLEDVFHRRAWSYPDKPVSQSVPREHEVDLDKTRKSRNIPWGVPVEATLGPQELLELIVSGRIPVDLDEEVSWMPRNPGSVPRGVTPNPDAADLEVLKAAGMKPSRKRVHSEKQARAAQAGAAGEAESAKTDGTSRTESEEHHDA